ncbi:MAG: hypothetical protein ACKVPX_06185 [Myxococcaceae bacterium]
MAKLVMLLLGLGAVGYVLYTQVKGSAEADGSPGASTARRTLDNARESARQIEQDAQKRADDLFQKTAAE